MDSNKDGVMEEVGALQSIFMDEIHLVRDKRDHLKEINITLHPATAQNEAEQYVCATLHIELGAEYPMTSPQTTLRNPRGLSDETLQRLHNACKRKATEYEGMPVLYELIEVGTVPRKTAMSLLYELLQLVRDGLTSCNIPSGECCICLLGFTEQDVFTRTCCYHHFHSRCLGSYVSATLKQFLEEEKRDKIEQPNRVDRPKRQVVCPVCREVISYDIEALMNAPAPSHGDELASFKPSPDIIAVQEKMARLFEKQQEKGGHVDSEKSELLVITKQSPNSNDLQKVPEVAEAVKQEEVAATSSKEVSASKYVPATRNEESAADTSNGRNYERFHHEKRERRGWQPRYRGWGHRHYEDRSYRDEQPRYRGRSRGRRFGASRNNCDRQMESENQWESERYSEFRKNEDQERRNEFSGQRRQGEYGRRNEFKKWEDRRGVEERPRRGGETARKNEFEERQRRDGESGRKNDFEERENQEGRPERKIEFEERPKRGAWRKMEFEGRQRREGGSGRKMEFEERQRHDGGSGKRTDYEERQRRQDNRPSTYEDGQAEHNSETQNEIPRSNGGQRRRQRNTEERGRRSYGTRYYRRRWSKEQPDSEKNPNVPKKVEPLEGQARAPVAPPPGFQFTAPPPGFAVRPHFSSSSS